MTSVDDIPVVDSLSIIFSKTLNSQAKEYANFIDNIELLLPKIYEELIDAITQQCVKNIGNDLEKIVNSKVCKFPWRLRVAIQDYHRNENVWSCWSNIEFSV